MSRWLVTTERPGSYQPENPLRNWTLSQMVVNAPTKEAAERHVIRTLTGDLGAITVEPFDGLMGQPPTPQSQPDPPVQHYLVPE